MNQLQKWERLAGEIDRSLEYASSVLGPDGPTPPLKDSRYLDEYELYKRELVATIDLLRAIKINIVCLQKTRELSGEKHERLYKSYEPHSLHLAGLASHLFYISNRPKV